MQFEVGQSVVYPGLGVGIVKAIESLEESGITYEVYTIKVLDDGSMVQVPLQSAGANGLRPVMGPDVLAQVDAVLRERPKKKKKETWNRRQRAFNEKIATGDPVEVATVLRDLSCERQGKPLSFGERRIYDRVLTLVVQELVHARDVDEDTIRRELDEIFKT
jgi:CarD family transcriptional regulator